MEKKKSVSFTLSIVAIIVGVALYKQFDFKTIKFENPGLALIYGVTFVASVYVLARGSQKKSAE